MTWREKLVVRILLLVARIACDDAALRDDLRHLSNHIASAPEPTPTREEA